MQIGINPGLFAAYKGHHYAGPGNHFCELYVSMIRTIDVAGYFTIKIPSLHNYTLRFVRLTYDFNTSHASQSNDKIDDDKQEKWCSRSQRRGLRDARRPARGANKERAMLAVHRHSNDESPPPSAVIQIRNIRTNEPPMCWTIQNANEIAHHRR